MDPPRRAPALKPIMVNPPARQVGRSVKVIPSIPIPSKRRGLHPPVCPRNRCNVTNFPRGQPLIAVSEGASRVAGQGSASNSVRARSVGDSFPKPGHPRAADRSGGGSSREGADAFRAFRAARPLDFSTTDWQKESTGPCPRFGTTRKHVCPCGARDGEPFTPRRPLACQRPGFSRFLRSSGARLRSSAAAATTTQHLLDPSRTTQVSRTLRSSMGEAVAARLDWTRHP